VGAQRARKTKSDFEPDSHRVASDFAGALRATRAGGAARSVDGDVPGLSGVVIFGKSIALTRCFTMHHDATGRTVLRLLLHSTKRTQRADSHRAKSCRYEPTCAWRSDAA